MGEAGRQWVTYFPGNTELKKLQVHPMSSGCSGGTVPTYVSNLDLNSKAQIVKHCLAWKFLHQPPLEFHHSHPGFPSLLLAIYLLRPVLCYSHAFLSLLFSVEDSHPLGSCSFFGLKPDLEGSLSVGFPLLNTTALIKSVLNVHVLVFSYKK